MTKENRTEIYVLTDRSGSMESIKDDVIGGFNSFIEEQKKEEGKCSVSYAQFDHLYEEVFNGVDIKEVEPLTRETFVPRGLTALLDSWGRSMIVLDERIKNKSEEERPTDVIFVVITDGRENSSQEFSHQSVKRLVEQREKDGWTFTFLAANQDAVKEGGKLGVRRDSTLTFNSSSKGVNAAYKSLSRKVAAKRKGYNFSYDDSDRKDSMK